MWLLVVAGERSAQKPVGRGRRGDKQELSTRRSTQLFAPGLGRARTWRSRGSVSLVAAFVHGNTVGNGTPPRASRARPDRVSRARRIGGSPLPLYEGDAEGARRGPP